MSEEESHSTHISEIWPEIRGYSVVDGEYTLIYSHGAGAFDIPIERVFDAVNYIIKHRQYLIPSKYKGDEKWANLIDGLTTGNPNGKKVPLSTGNDNTDEQLGLN